MPHTQVSEIDLNDTGSVSLTVEFFGFEPGTIVEISGHASQDNGVIATFYDVQNSHLRQVQTAAPSSR